MNDPTVGAAIIAAVAALLTAVITATTTLLGVLIGALPTYLITRSQHKMELARFYSQRWWEKKAEAYSSIMEQLSDLHSYYDQWHDELTGSRTMSGERRRELRERYGKVRESVERAAAVGSFIVSDEAAAALEHLVSQLSQRSSRNLLEDVEGHYMSVIECINEVRKCAKDDLEKP